MKNDKRNDVHAIAGDGLVELLEMLLEMEERIRGSNIKEKKEGDLWVVLDKDGNQITL